MTDAGANYAGFHTCRFPVHACQIGPEQVDFIVDTLITHLSVARMDIIVLEVLDDLACQETTSVLSSRILQKSLTPLFLHPSDAKSAITGRNLKASGIASHGNWQATD